MDLTTIVYLQWKWASLIESSLSSQIGQGHSQAQFLPLSQILVE